MSFGKASDCGIARHGTDRIGVDHREQGLAAHSGGRQGCFTTGMAGAYNHYIVFFSHHFFVGCSMGC
jgi:hypothetical protein